MGQHQDPTAETRKADHIKMAFESALPLEVIDGRFDYEPMLTGNDSSNVDITSSICGIKMLAPIWISSMTGGTAMAGKINKNLAKLCGELGLGMGLGSCRSLLYDETHIEDFRVRKLCGEFPLFINLGIAQLEMMVADGSLSKVSALIARLEANGLIIHVNPLQEWLQPEGDRYKLPPIDTIKRVRDELKYPIIVKEVGHGYSRRSMEALIDAGVDVIDFAANGGTNFSNIELYRSAKIREDVYRSLARVGHHAEEMVDMSNQIDRPIQVIVSGGVKNFLDGYYFIEKCHHHAIFGMASEFLRYAMEDYDTLHDFGLCQVQGLQIAKSLLKIRKK